LSSIFGEILTFSQEKGPDVKLKVFGDEFYSRYENLDGYSAVYDIDLGLFCYAYLIKGEFVSSGVDLSEAPPDKIWRHLKESEEVRRDKFESRFVKMNPPAPAYRPSANLRTFGPNKGLMEGRRVSEGKIRGLTVLTQFQDVRTTATREDVDRMLNGENYRENGNFCSAREYFRLMSGGKLDYTNEVVGPITLSRNRSYYTFHLLVEEALDLAIAGGLDLRKFDSKGEGIVDAMNFLYAGQTQYIGELWPHNYFIELERGGMKTCFYMLSSMGFGKEDMSIGTFCHENGHMLCRWPDLYDYGNRDDDSVKSSGLGYYCLMSAGNHNNYGCTPAPVCAYLRHIVGWCDNVVRLDKSGEYQALHGDYSTAMVYESRKFNEYFLVENRSQLGLDEYIPSSGLAIYHCDILGSNEWQEGTLSKHFQCGLIQADGHLDLETNRNMGDERDLFAEMEGIAISHSTVPSSNLWDGSESGLVISRVSGPGQAITFIVGTSGQTQLAKGLSSPEKAIPDRYTKGVSDSILMDKSGTVKKIKVDVNIDHPNIGDLKVEIVSPGGKKALLHNRAGGTQDNLVKTYDSDSMPKLAAMIGQSLKGNWGLIVKDLVKGNAGRLNKWSLEVVYY
jgi:M6 family metalloprotease-like protein